MTHEEKLEKKIEERSVRNEKKRKAFSDWMEIVTEVLELTVAVIVLVGFVINVIPFIKDMPSLLDNSNDYTFHIFLEHAFNLVIGIEFIRMLIRHTPGSALDVLLFSIARHMVLDGGNGVDLILGVASIAGIFAIRKWLYVRSFDGSHRRSGYQWIHTEDDGEDDPPSDDNYAN